MPTSLRRRIAAALLLATAVTGVPAACAGVPRAVADTKPASLPSDPKAKGYIGFCDEAGHNVIGGDIHTKPFVWKAVASAPPPAAYQGNGQDAVLNVYQPRPDARPFEWSGSSLTAASFYTNRAAPSVQATYQDLSLADVMALYPPKVNGLYVLRIFWGRKNYGLYSATYPVTTIQVRGSRWSVVSGGTVDCGPSTRAVSLEQLTGVATKQDITPRAVPTGQATAPSGRPRSLTSTPATIASGTNAATSRGPSALADGSGSSPAAGAPSASASSSSRWVIWSLVGAVAALAAALILVTRRRRAPSTASAPTRDLAE